MFEIISKRSDWWINAEVSYTRAQADKTQCRLCLKRLKTVYPQVLRPVLRTILRQHIVNGTSGAEVTVLRNDFYEVIKPFMKNFIFCPLFRIDGSEITTHIGCYEQYPARLRGNAKSEYFGRCPVCRQPVYRPCSDPAQYIMSHDVKRRSVIQTTTKGLLISDFVAKKIDWTLFKSKELLPIDIRTVPIDGLPPHIDDWPEDPIDPSIERFGPD